MSLRELLDAHRRHRGCHNGGFRYEPQQEHPEGRRSHTILSLVKYVQTVEYRPQCLLRRLLEIASSIANHTVSDAAPVPLMLSNPLSVNVPLEADWSPYSNQFDTFPEMHLAVFSQRRQP